MGRSHQQMGETARKDKEAVPIRRYVAPGVYYGTDGMITADSLDNAILFLREEWRTKQLPPRGSCES